MDWFDLLAVQGTFKCLLQHHSLKASILQHSAFFMVQLSHPYMTTGRTMPLTIGTCVGKVMSLLFNTLSRLVIIAFLPRNKHLLIPWLQSPSALILKSTKMKSDNQSTPKRLSCQEICPHTHPLNQSQIYSYFLMQHSSFHQPDKSVPSVLVWIFLGKGRFKSRLQLDNILVFRLDDQH